jgi:hypothetical protein
MNKKKIIITSIGAVATAGLLATAGITSAHFGGIFTDNNREKIQVAETNMDYQTWKTLQDSAQKITDYINTPEKFSKFLQMKKLLKEKNFTGAEKLRKDLGLPVMPEKGLKGNPAAREAVEKDDYQAWLKAMPSSSPIIKIIKDKTSFEKYVEMHKARKSGDTVKAEKIRQELGLPEKKIS